MRSAVKTTVCQNEIVEMLRARAFRHTHGCLSHSSCLLAEQYKHVAFSRRLLSFRRVFVKRWLVPLGALPARALLLLILELAPWRVVSLVLLTRPGNL